jgi:hypothetical protein
MITANGALVVAYFPKGAFWEVRYWLSGDVEPELARHE